MAKQIKRTGKFTLPSNLSFRRSIDVSDGMLNSVMPDGSLLPVTVEQLTVRGALGMSNAGYDKAGKPLEGEALALAQYNPNKPNIQSIDRATLDPESDTLELSFSVAFHDGCMAPDACSKAEYREALMAFMKVATEKGLYDELAIRYLWNLVNGRVLWRNGYGIAEGVSLTVSGGTDGGAPYRFDWGKLKDRRTFPGREAIVAACVSNDKEVVVDSLVSKIAAALRGVDGLFAADVAIRVRSYHGAEVWPSQEFVEGSQTKRNGRDISRILASRTRKVAGQTVRHGVMHSQKIGNALRTVDEWHGDAGFGAIPVEAFGWVQAELAAARAPSAKQGIDAYRALESVAVITEGLADGDEASRKDALYTLAIMIRGGVWGVSEKEDKPAA
jgi:CRISPR-associated protein Csy3